MIGGTTLLAQGLVSESSLLTAAPSQVAQDDSAAPELVAPELIQRYCFDCHGDGADEGNLSLDSVMTAADPTASTVDDHQRWWKVLKNLRSGVMPPPEMDAPTAEEQKIISDWIKFQVFQIDPANPDPGRLPVRRLNRAEYENTVNTLMGTRIDATLIFPADDSGNGFDNVGDALSFSPILMEKYLDAARMVVREAVPTETKIVPLQVFRTRDFQYPDGRRVRRDLDGKQSHQILRRFEVAEPGTFQVDVGIKLHGSFDFDSARYNATFSIDGDPKLERECGWDEYKLFEYHYDVALDEGEHQLEFQLDPIPPGESEEVVGNGGTFVRFEIAWVRVEGPAGTTKLVHPRNYERFFTRDQPPEDPEQRRAYAAEVLRQFATKAYRSEVPEETVQRLVAIAEREYERPDKSFEAGVAEAIVAVLTSPRFLFHLEVAPAYDDQTSEPSVLISETALASRLSYFLWSTMPDEELLSLAAAGKLRDQLPEQIDRMLKDDRSQQLLSNFVGQWLKTRDVIQKDVDPLAVLGAREEYEEMMAEFRRRFRRGGFRRDAEPTEEERRRRDRFQELRTVLETFDEGLKRSMQRETEMCFEYLLQEDQTLLDLLDSDYTFLNDRLARHYGIPGVQGGEMRRVTLPEGSPRGGVLTQASMLLVTANPTRTSPVKRGLFVLENLLGTPAPPAPPDIPELEASADQFEGKQPSLRELLAVHRESALCSSCHSRMDPIGLALENFNALGQWREQEHDQVIDPSGELISGESFANVVELKRILRQNHATAFYRCLTEKMLTYALGRGVEYYDQQVIDAIVEELEASGGKPSVLITGIIQSAPFQRQQVIDPNAWSQATSVDDPKYVSNSNFPAEDSAVPTVGSGEQGEQ